MTTEAKAGTWQSMETAGQCSDQDGAEAGAPESPELLSPEYLAHYQEWWEQKEGPDIPVEYAGSVTFYGQAGDEWWEFCAFIQNGKCVRILQVEPVQPKGPS